MSARDEIERMLNEAFNFGGEFERAGSKEKVDTVLREYFALIDKAVAAIAPPAPDEVRLTLSREDAEWWRDVIDKADCWGSEHEAARVLDVLTAALAAAAAPGDAR